MKILVDCAFMNRVELISHNHPCCSICYGNPDSVVTDNTGHEYTVCCKTISKLGGRVEEDRNTHVYHYEGVIGGAMPCIFKSSGHEDSS